MTSLIKVASNFVKESHVVGFQFTGPRKRGQTSVMAIEGHAAKVHAGSQ